MTRRLPGLLPLLAAALTTFVPLTAQAAISFADFERGLDCSLDPCTEVLPGATEFRALPDRPWVEGLDAEGEVVGWTVLSIDVVDIKAYSGKPIVTLIGLDDEGVIAGVRILQHSEPILLVGIPEQVLHDFVASYVGNPADEKVVIAAEEPGARTVDMISGATVTVLAENRTILEVSRGLGEEMGVIPPAPRVPGHWVEGVEPWDWERIVRKGGLGHLVVTHEQMELPPSPDDEPFIDIHFGMVDAPALGIPLLGEPTWRRAIDRLEPGEHLFAMFGNGTSSFKGSSFVRGGIFDRVRLEQGLRNVVFRDLDYKNIGTPQAEGAPHFSECGLFVARDDRLDPGARYDLVFLGSAFTLDGGIERDFKAFRSTHRLPKSIYKLDGPDPESLVWRAAWQRQSRALTFVLAWFVLVIAVFGGRRWSAATLARIQRVHLVFLLVAFLGLGLVLRLQPSITQLLTLIGAVIWEWRWGLFLSDPLLFVSWIFIAVTTLAWGRGVFCGWVCPYGALSELLFKLGRLVKLPAYELPDRIHSKARYLRYVVLAALVAIYLASPVLGEKLAEVEPFKSTFFVAPWTRHVGLLLWWLALALVAVVVWRPFCRYVCPLGAALALPSSFRASGPYRREFCGKGCKICPEACEPRAIRKDGSIDARECLNCWECEATYHDEQRCPPLVQIRRQADKARQGRRTA
jgi:NosR/NirI family transcriptional regulator, nitrous oxide reductase regulator